MYEARGPASTTFGAVSQHYRAVKRPQLSFDRIFRVAKCTTWLENAQNGFTITIMTIRISSSVGTSLAMRQDLSLRVFRSSAKSRRARAKSM